MKIVEQTKKKVPVTQSILVWAIQYALKAGFPASDDCVSNLTDVWENLEDVIKDAIIKAVDDALESGKMAWQNTECWEALLDEFAPEVEFALEGENFDE